ncbi:hypothetical protein [Oceanibium sediminis]|uniref:hypothetical protein n=1 Tax=Oceanibium sediminis TaxID=2026339 RepID=UPI000DD4C37C|nr:hypothetical protein [Oceanibium sediminis]
MEDNRKLAVSFGTFACVIEGYDDPFSIMRKTVRYFENLAEQHPGFADFADLVDHEALIARLGDVEGAEIELEHIAGGVHIRKLARPALEGDGAIDMPEPEEDVSEEDLADLAALDAAPSGGLAMPMSPLPGEEAELDDNAEPEQADMQDDTQYSGDTRFEDLPESAYADGDDIDAPADESPRWPATERDDSAFADSGEQEDHGADTEAFTQREDASPFQSTSGFGRPLHNADEDSRAEVDDQDVAAEAAAFSASLGDDVESEDLHPGDDDFGDEDDSGDEEFVSAEAPTQDEEEDDRDAPLILGASGPGPLRLDRTTEEPGEPDEDTEPDVGPLRLGAEPHEAESGESDAAVRPLFLRRTPDPEPEEMDAGTEDTEEDAPPAAAKPAALGTLRLGPELKPVPPANADTERPSFIDTVAPKEPATPETPEETAADTDVEQEVRGGLRLGNLLRRKSSGDKSDDKADTAAEAEAEAAKPRSGLLRVVESDTNEADTPEPSPDASPAAAPEEPSSPAPEAASEAKPDAAKESSTRSGFRSFLRGKPKAEPAEPTPDAPEKPHAVDTPSDAAAPEPAPKPAASQPAPGAAPASDGDSLKDRLHASYASAPEPAGTTTFDLDDDGDEDDPSVTTPRGFAKAAGASALHEVMAAAAAYLSLVEHRATMNRAEIMDCAQTITGGAPLTAEAKVKAFGKLTRTGELVRLDGGLFMMSEEALLRYRETLDGAA